MKAWIPSNSGTNGLYQTSFGTGCARIKADPLGGGLHKNQIYQNIYVGIFSEGGFFIMMISGWPELFLLEVL